MNCTNGVQSKPPFFDSTISAESADATKAGGQTVSGKTQDNRKVDIVVHVSQYNGPECYLDYFRGYGDIASGVRIIDHIKNSRFKDRKIAFVIDYFGDPGERERIESMATIKDVQPLIMSRKEKREDQQKELEILLRNADCIINGPSFDICEIQGNDKQIYLDEYGMFKDEYGTSFLYKYDNYTGRDPYHNRFSSNRSKVYATGIELDMLHLFDGDQHNKVFDNNAIAKVFSSVEINENPLNDNPVCFIYPGCNPQHSILAAIHYAFKFHIQDSKKAIIFSSVKFDEIKHALEQLNVIVDFIYEIKYTDLKERPVDLISTDSIDKWLREKITDRNNKKCIFLVNPFPLSNNDFNKLIQISSLVFASGDISCSDTLSFGKIPIMDIDKKPKLYRALEAKLADSGRCSGRFIEIWKQLSVAFSGSYKPGNSEINIPESSLMDKQFHSDHQRFTAYLKAANKLPGIINAHLKRTLEPHQSECRIRTTQNKEDRRDEWLEA